MVCLFFSAGTDFVLFGTLDLLLSVFELSSLSSSFLFDLFSEASSDLSESDFVFLEIQKNSKISQVI